MDEVDGEEDGDADVRGQEGAGGECAGEEGVEAVDEDQDRE